MSAFDVAIGLNEDGMNSLSQQVYQRIYPNVFRGTTSAGGNTVSYDIKTPPKFNLLTTSEAQDALKQYLAQHTGNLTPDEQQFVNDMSQQVPTFILDFGEIDATLDSGGGNTTSIPFTATAYCHALVNNSTLTLTPFHIDAKATSGGGAANLLLNIMIHQLMSVSQQLVQSITIPPITISGVALEPPIVGIEGNQIVVVTNVQGKGSPAFPSGQSWPNDPFFSLLSQDLLQAAAAANPQAPMTGGDSSVKGAGPFKFGAEYGYNFTMVNPRVAINGTGLDIAFDLSGSISAGVYIFGHIGLCYGGSATPTPTAHCSLSVQGNSLEIVANNISAFTIFVTPCGDVPSQVLSWMTEFIVAGIVASLTPAVSAFLHDIHISSLQIPAYTLPIDGQNLTMNPVNLSVIGVPGYIGLVGGLQLS